MDTATGKTTYYDAESIGVNPFNSMLTGTTINNIPETGTVLDEVELRDSNISSQNTYESFREADKAGRTGTIKNITAINDKRYIAIEDESGKVTWYEDKSGVDGIHF
jgi:hypothetical protein